MNERQSNGEIDVQIGELVIDGGRGIDRAGLAAAVESELGRLVAASGLDPAAATHARIDAGTLAPSSTADGGAVGRRVAQAVYRTLGGNR